MSLTLRLLRKSRRYPILTSQSNNKIWVTKMTSHFVFWTIRKMSICKITYLSIWIHPCFIKCRIKVCLANLMIWLIRKNMSRRYANQKQILVNSQRLWFFNHKIRFHQIMIRMVSNKNLIMIIIKVESNNQIIVAWTIVNLNQNNSLWIFLVIKWLIKKQ